MERMHRLGEDNRKDLLSLVTPKGGVECVLSQSANFEV